MFLVGRALVGVTRRHRDPIDAELGHGIEEARDTFRIRIVEQGAVDVDAEALGLGRFERLDRAVVDACLAHRFVMHLLSPSRCIDQLKFVRGLYWLIFFSSSSAFVQTIANFPLRAIPFDDLRQFPVQQRFAARHDDNGSAALIDRGQASSTEMRLLRMASDNRSCRSPHKRDCSETAARASTPEDSVCGPQDAAERHRRQLSQSV